MSKNKAIIVKKVKKTVGGGHHGGSWKVAYADFVTAMMAFFLLMWLLNMTSEEKRARLSSYFKYFSIYESGGTSWMDKSSEIFGESGENKQKVFTAKISDTDKNADATDYKLQQEAKVLKDDLEEKLGDMKDQVLVDIVDEGIRIQMIDKEGSLMFEQGNPKLTPKAIKVLELIGKDIKKYPNKVIIEGHTDSLPYAGSQYSNWELSTERASSARKELEATGLDPKRITRVAGYADTDPLIKDNKQDPRNRRISITLSIPKKDIPKMHSAKTPVISSDEKQQKKVLEEIRYMIDNSQIPAADEKKQIHTLPENNADIGKNKTGESQTTIMKQEWPAFRPIQKSDPEISENEKSPDIRNHDYDSMIREGESALKNGNSNSKIKAPSKIVENKSRVQPVIKNEEKGSVIIKELSEPIIKLN